MTEKRQLKVIHRVGSRGVRAQSSIAVTETEGDPIHCQSWLRKNTPFLCGSFSSSFCKFSVILVVLMLMVLLAIILNGGIYTYQS